ncbi:hypothetical protein HCN44_010362 [Aphidius gifuensis]|uniref:Uncharacterized protein n=1 Tax=Aphidius gifuensis TaxID=684658 RepID=A0A835CRX8_APHGI|nr:hypothetical protein HCN44_010362 [Aphidius gifuensis]
MFAQLNHHLACLIIRRTKREQDSWTEDGRLCAPLLLTTMHCSPIDTVKYRGSQAAHVLQDSIRNDVKRLTDQVINFANDTTKNSPIRLLLSTELAEFHQISEQVFPASLHHHVWIGIVNKPKPLKSQNS